MSIKQNRDLMVENIKKVRTQLNEHISWAPISRDDQKDFEKVLKKYHYSLEDTKGNELSFENQYGNAEQIRIKQHPISRRWQIHVVFQTSHSDINRHRNEYNSFDNKASAIRYIVDMTKKIEKVNSI